MSKNVSNFFISLLYLLLGIVFLIYKDTIFTTLKFVVGIAFLVIGLVRIIIAIMKRKDNKKSATLGDFTVGLIIAVVGILLLLPVLDNAFALAFGIFFIFDAVLKLVTAFSTANTKNIGWWISVIIALLILGTGIFIIAKWSLIVKYIAIVIGIVLIVSGIQGFIAILTGKKS